MLNNEIDRLHVEIKKLRSSKNIDDEYVNEISRLRSELNLLKNDDFHEK